MKALDVKEALHARYTGERYVCIEEARGGAGFDGNRGQADFIAINTWQGRGMEIIGHEVKVSMSDWHTELAKPEKAERFARYCHRWYVVVPSDLAKKIKHEVPTSWGLLSIAESGRITETKKPERRDPEPVSEWWWIGWLAQIDRQHKRRLPQLVQAGLVDERESIRKQAEHDLELHHKARDSRLEDLSGRLARLTEATGIDLAHDYTDWARLKRAWVIAKHSSRIGGIPRTLREVADALDAAVDGAA